MAVTDLDCRCDIDTIQSYQPVSTGCSVNWRCEKNDLSASLALLLNLIENPGYQTLLATSIYGSQGVLEKDEERSFSSVVRALVIAIHVG